MRYSFELLPNLGLSTSTNPQTLTAAPQLSSSEINSLQCAYIWLQTYTERSSIPCSLNPSYSELWFILKYFIQIQSTVRSMSSSFASLMEAHSHRYHALAMEHQIQCDSYEAMLTRNFDVLAAIIGNCANYHGELEQSRFFESAMRL
jgi:hypothetical protein